jgi:hypothetical protein
MKRRLLNLLTVLSLLLGVAVVALWVRSYFRADTLRRVYVPDRQRHGIIFQASFNRGVARLTRYDLRYSGPPADDLTPMLRPGIPSWSSRKSRPTATTAERWLLAFSYDDGTASPGTAFPERVRAVVVPLWTFAILFAAPPAVVLRRRLCRCRATAAELCPTCGYDLRATPGRCPECGEAQ